MLSMILFIISTTLQVLLLLGALLFALLYAIHVSIALHEKPHRLGSFIHVLALYRTVSAYPSFENYITHGDISYNYGKTLDHPRVGMDYVEIAVNGQNMILLPFSGLLYMIWLYIATFKYRIRKPRKPRIKNRPVKWKDLNTGFKERNTPET